MNGVQEREERGGWDRDPTAGAPDSTSFHCVARGEGRGFQSRKEFPVGGHSREQSIEWAAGAARSWVDPRWSLELRRRESAGERSCLERGQSRYRTEVR